MFKGLAVFILGLMSSSWLLTKTWHFSYGPYLSRKVYTALTKEQTFTVEELAQFDGTDPKKPIYLSIVYPASNIVERFMTLLQARTTTVLVGATHFLPDGMLPEAILPVASRPI